MIAQLEGFQCDVGRKEVKKEFDITPLETQNDVFVSGVTGRR